MLSNSDLSSELESLARQARDLAGAVKSNGDLPARQLAAGLVEAAALAARLEKLAGRLSGVNGKKGKR
ncbi:MAG TPA: hypothetical protein VH682_24590 [Gemmataceae bacterium]|jgi:hypothetical protein